MPRAVYESDAERGPPLTPPEQAYHERVSVALPELRRRMQDAAVRSGRPADAVRLLAVTKGHPLAAVRAARAAGLCDLAENRPESLVERRGAFPDPDVRWHLIGHVQRRKAPDAVEAAHLFHALDSVRLAERLDRVADETGRRLPVLVQVNTSGEGSKGGFTVEEAPEALTRLVTLPGLLVRGLMTMAPFVEEEEPVRETFRRLRALHEDARRAVAGYEGTELSMGMTNDYEIAIEEGSTMIRIGTALFGERIQAP
ncbi:MAG: YggS family pyridoxal phosphate-dependent enzyme [Gemmatimonadota bacterium]